MDTIGAWVCAMFFKYEAWINSVSFLRYVVYKDEITSILFGLGVDNRYRCGSRGRVFHHMNFRGIDPCADPGVGI